MMRAHEISEALPRITTSDLNRRTREVLGRISGGERLIVCHHGKPVATLQPLDGYVLQPFTGTVHDVFGWPFGDEASQLERLSEPQRRMLADGYRQWRLRPTRVDHLFDWSVIMRELRDMYARGLAVKTDCGNELTGRGLALREALLRREGRWFESGA